MKEKKNQPRILYPAKSSLKREREIQKLRVFIAGRPVLQKMLNRKIIYNEDKKEKRLLSIIKKKTWQIDLKRQTIKKKKWEKMMN